MTNVSPCQLIVDPPLPGAWNMAVDEALLESAANDGIATLRIYQWAEPTLSLGYFQRYADRYQHAASRASAVVRRQSGGGAILHDRELTYSLTLPPTHPLARQNQSLYSAIHQAVIDLLRPSMIAFATNWRLDLQPQESTENAHQQPFLCFQRRARGDLVLACPRDPRTSIDSFPSSGNWKILGSAQRRYRGAILQHGSLLIRRSPAAPELPGLGDLLGIDVDIDDLAGRLPQSLASALRLSLRSVKLPNEMRQTAAVTETRKYGHPSWTNRR